MKAARPVNRDVTKYRFPLTAIVSIFHRISGVVLFVLIPWLMYLLSHSLASANDFAAVQTELHQPLAKFLMWVVLAALSFHWVAGVRHIMMDMGYAESLKGGQIGAKVVMLVSAVLIILMGVWLW